jgi:hypothetical protein
VLNGITYIAGEPPALRDAVTGIHTVAQAWDFLDEKKKAFHKLLSQKPKI